MIIIILCKKYFFFPNLCNLFNIVIKNDNFTFNFLNLAKMHNHYFL